MSEEANYGPALLETTIREEWIGYNGHMNMAYYIMPARFDKKIMNRLLTTLPHHKELGMPREMGRSIAIRRHFPENMKKAATGTEN